MSLTELALLDCRRPLPLWDITGLINKYTNLFRDPYHLSAETFGVAVTFWTRIQEVLCSNHGRNVGYTERGFRGFSQSFHTDISSKSSQIRLL
jgi:hypothetical protein